MSQQSAHRQLPQVHVELGVGKETVMRVMKVLMNKDIKLIAGLGNVREVQGYENFITLCRVVLSLVALAGKASEVEELLGEVDGLELFVKTDFQRHLERGNMRACACISWGLHILDNPIPFPRGAGCHDVGCKECVAGVNILTTLDTLVVHAKARGVQVLSVLLEEHSDELVDVAGNIVECRRRFKHFCAHLAHLVIEHV